MKKYLIILFAVLLAIAIIGCAEQNDVKTTNSYINVNATKAKELIDNTKYLVIIDVSNLMKLDIYPVQLISQCHNLNQD